MYKNFIKFFSTVALSAGFIPIANASVCQYLPGAVVCGSGTVDHLSGNGTVTVNGTIVNGQTSVNGLLNATDANFSGIDVNGSASFIQCTVNGISTIKGSLTSSSSKFQNSLDVYSNEIRFINTKISGDLHIFHTESKRHIVFLDNFSEVSGNVIFDDNDGEVIVRGGSKVNGQIIGGKIVDK